MVNCLVRAPNWLGDCLMSTIFLDRLSHKYPEYKISVLCREAHQEVYKNLDFVDEILPYGDQRPPFSLVKKKEWDVSYILPNSFSAAFLFWRAKIRERIGYASEGRSLFLTNRLKMDKRWHYVRRYLGLIGEGGADLHGLRPIYPGKESGKVAFDLLINRPLKNPVIGIAPGSIAPARRWSKNRFASIIQKIDRELKGSILLFGGPGDGATSKEVAELSGVNVFNTTGQTDLNALAAGMSRCQTIITNESGAMHMAWAVGTPLVVLSGPSEPRLTSPWGESVRILHHRELFCSPCVRNECWRGGPEYKECMDRIQVEDVWATLESLLTLK